MENESQELAVIKSEINIYNGASMLKIDDTEQTKLLASFETKEIEIRPDGLIYLPQTFWRKRLNESFGIGQWCLIVKSSTKDPNKSKLYLQGILMARGCYVAESVGESEYHEENALQSWASVWESAKSDCITRCCKDLGIASELWQPEFIKAWITDNALKVWINTAKKGDPEKLKAVWRKKTSEKFWNEIDNKKPTQPAKPEAKKQPEKINIPPIHDTELLIKAIELMKVQKTIEGIKKVWSDNKVFQTNKEFIDAKELMKVAINLESDNQK
jgi:hypothetical protein